MKNASPNYTLLAVTLILVFLGITAIASASWVLSWNKFGNTHHFLTHQFLVGVIPGLLLMTLLSRFDYHKLRYFAWPVLAVAIIMLVAVLLPEVGVSVGGARRWLNLGFGIFQPSEFAKIALVIYLAAWFEKRGRSLDDFKSGFLPSVLAVGAVVGLIFMQPDMGTLIVISLTAAAMYFTAGTKLRHLFGTAVLALGGLAIAITAAPYRANRIITFLDPTHDPQGIGYHVNQALLAVGSGGLFGYGYNHGLQKHNYLPEPMGDSIFSIMAEELGFIRVSLVVFLYLLLAYTGFKVAKNASDDFGRLLAVGIVTWISVQAFINIGANLGVMPLTGIPLPFISYGSSSLVITLAAMGVLLNVSRYSRA